MQEAAGQYRQILAANPDDAEANHLLGLIAHQMGNGEVAVNLIGKAIRLTPKSALYHSNMGAVLKELGRNEAAIASYEVALKIEPGAAHTHANLGVAQLALGDIAAAEASQRRALELEPGNVEAHNNLGLVLAERGDVAAAEAEFEAAVVLRPGYVNGLHNLGSAQKALGQSEAAAASFRAAIAAAPRHAGAHYGLGGCLIAMGEPGQAVAHLRTAISISPTGAAYRNLGRALYEIGQAKEAAEAFRAALAADPKDTVSRWGLGNALLGLNEYREAEINYRAALEQMPDNNVTRKGLAAALVGRGAITEARAVYKAILEADPDHLDALGGMQFTGNYIAEGAPLETLAGARRFGEVAARGVEIASAHANDKDPKRKLRIGLVSGDLFHHSVSRFLESALREIDQSQYELFAYSNSYKIDQVTLRLMETIGNWTSAASKDDAQLAASIVDDRIDILVDLSGHTGANRLSAFARKPAPVQVSWLGYSGTTGLDAMDYVLADRWVIPEGEENQYSETPWRLPDSYLCFTPVRFKVDTAPTPALKNGFVTFGSFNNAGKIGARTVGCWAEVLKAVPDSRLLLKSNGLGDAGLVQSVKDRFAAHGIPSDRLDLRGALFVVAEHLGTYNEVDIGLDPFPYAGTTTTAEALWMAVPVLTLKGDRFIAHVGESILHTVGLDDWIADGTEDYVARAARFAADIPALDALRSGLRDRFVASPLCDAPRFARNLEDAFRGMWKIWCDKHG